MAKKVRKLFQSYTSMWVVLWVPLFHVPHMTLALDKIARLTSSFPLEKPDPPGVVHYGRRVPGIAVFTPP